MKSIGPTVWASYHRLRCPVINVAAIVFGKIKVNASSSNNQLKITITAFKIRLFFDTGRAMRAMPDGSPALLKTRKHLHRVQAEKLWKELVRTGWCRSEPLWGSAAEP